MATDEISIRSVMPELHFGRVVPGRGPIIGVSHLDETVVTFEDGSTLTGAPDGEGAWPTLLLERPERWKAAPIKDRWFVEQDGIEALVADEDSARASYVALPGSGRIVRYGTDGAEVIASKG